MDNQENNSFVHDELPEVVEIIGISFRGATKIYYFAANGCVAKEGDNAIVETARGLEYGKVTLTNAKVKREELVLPLKNVIRIANKNDDMRYEANRDKEKDAFDICAKKILDHKLDMKLIDVEYTFDNSKLLFYFTSDDRVDFRELVKDLAGYFRTRIELRQIGIRDEAKIMGGLGICGRPFCCNTFLPDFVQVSIKMAKEQNLSLNSAKISGACGRLMCCLRYEYDTYQEELRRMPKIDTTVVTPDGVGVVTELKPLQNIVKVMLSNENEKQPKQYHLSVLKPFDKSATEVPEKTEVSPENKSVQNERRVPYEEKRKKNDERSAEPTIKEDRKEERDDKKNHKNQNHNKNHHRDRREKNDHSNKEMSVPEKKTPPASASDSLKTGEVASQENTGKKNRHNRNRHHHKKQGGEKKDVSEAVKEKPIVQTEQRKPVQQPNVSSKESDNKKNYAPLPSNSIKKGNRNRFGQIKSRPGNAFSAVTAQEKKDNSEKK